MQAINEQFVGRMKQHLPASAGTSQVWKIAKELPVEIPCPSLPNKVNASRVLVYKKKERPLFKGDALCTMDLYFQVSKIPNEERLDQVKACLRVALLHWYIWMQERYMFNNWYDFKIQIARNFNLSLW